MRQQLFPPRYVAAFITVMCGCSLAWDVGDSLTWLRFRITPDFIPRLFYHDLMLHWSSIILWAGIGLSIGLGARIIAPTVNLKDVGLLGFIWGVSAFVWWQFPTYHDPLDISELSYRLLGQSYFHLGTPLAVLATLLVLVHGVRFRVWHVLLLACGLGAARYVVSQDIDLVWFVSDWPETFTYPVLPRSLHGMVFGLVAGTAVVAGLWGAACRVSGAAMRDMLSPRPHVVRLARQIVIPSSKLIIIFFGIFTVLSLAAGGAIYMTRPSFFLRLSYDLIRTWSPEKPTAYFIIFASAVILMNIVLASIQLPPRQVREIAQLSNITYGEETAVYTRRGLGWSLLMLSVVPGMGLMLESIVLSGSKVIGLRGMVQPFASLWISGLMMVQALGIVILLQAMCLYAYSSMAAKDRKISGVVIAIGILIAGCLTSIFLIGGSGPDDDFFTFWEVSWVLMPTMVLVLLWLCFRWLVAFGGSVERG